jgi:hypothetical protein
MEAIDMKSMQPSRRRRPQLRVEQLETRLVLSGGLAPTAAEQLLIYELNQIRANPVAYGASIGVDLGGLAPAQPLAIDPLMTQAATLHAQDMNTQGYFSQTSPQGVGPGQRLTQAGVDWTSWGEASIAGASYTSTASALQGLITDSTSSTLADRMLLLALSAQFETQSIVGVGIVQNGSGPLTNYYTIDTASIGNDKPFITGVVFTDGAGTGKYSAGEGIGEVTLTITGEGTSTTTATYSTGGYSAQLSPGTYTITASGGGLTSPVTQTVTLTTSNVEVDFVLSPTQVQTQQAAWIGLMYRDILGRTPQASEIANWVGDLQSGATRADVANGFLYSPEYCQDLVSDWYQAYLHRLPDAGGLSAFSAALENGASEDSVQAGILGSREFYIISGNTPSGFVNALYQDILGRTPSTTEAAGWVNLASTGQNMTVVNGLLSSAEARTVEVTDYYQTLLRRNPDAAGLSNFVVMLESGAGQRTIQRDLMTSAEYYHEAGDILWLESLYQNVLGRNGDSVSQLGNWLAVLNGGQSLDQVATGILASTEEDTDVVTALYHELLNRAPDSAGLNYNVNLLQTSGYSATVIEALAASSEFYKLQGGTDTSWVQGLYHDLLNRYGSQTEVQSWLNDLNAGQTRQQVVGDFLASTEYQTDYITNLFSLYLQRLPTEYELGQYIAQLQSGMKDANFIGGLLASNAYYQLVTG